MTRRRQEHSLLLLLLGLVLNGAHGSESPATTDDSPAPALPTSVATLTAAPSPSGVSSFSLDVERSQGVPKECPLSDAARASFIDEIDWQVGYIRQNRLQITGPSVCSILGVEPFNGDKPFALSFLGRLYRGMSTDSEPESVRMESIEATFGDVLVQFGDTPDTSSIYTVKVYNVSAANIGRDGRFMSRYVEIKNFTSDPLAVQTAGSPAPLPAAGRRRLAQRLPEPAKTSDPCDAPKAFCRAAVKAVKSLGPLCPASEADRRALASQIFQTCGAAYCRNPQPIDERPCYEKNAICHARLAQLLTCATARRCERALESDDRAQLGCNQPKRDPFFSKGCSGVVYQPLAYSEAAGVAKKFNVTVEELKAANAGRDLRAPMQLICIPAKPAGCGQQFPNRTQDGSTLAYRIPVQGKSEATITWQSAKPTNYYLWERVTVRDQDSGLLLDGAGRVENSTSSLTVSLPAGTREIALVLSAPDYDKVSWTTGITCQ